MDLNSSNIVFFTQADSLGFFCARHSAQNGTGSKIKLNLVGLGGIVYVNGWVIAADWQQNF
ncbi:hypothetical protein N577_011930 [Lacticaseibacillus rhamnosus 2166]|nr:hypothetical protein N577_011930 [Lacticaseibacillus rhamnosus 2166]